MATILIVDDEKNIRATLGRGLRLEGYATLEAGDGEPAESYRHMRRVHGRGERVFDLGTCAVHVPQYPHRTS